MQRIVVYGVAGSGKSTMARRIADRLGLPYHDVDELA
jgi:shikimate kinase